MSGQAGDVEPELLVDSCLHGGLGVADDVAQVAQAGDEVADVVFGELADDRVAVLAGVAGERGGALGFDLAGPLGDGLRVGSGVEGGLVAGEPGVAAGDEGLGVFGGRGEPGGARALKPRARLRYCVPGGVIPISALRDVPVHRRATVRIWARCFSQMRQ